MLFASAGSPVSGHDAIDIACAAALLEPHDHSAHRIGTEPGQGPEHCDACHFTRTVRGTFQAHQLRDVFLPQQAAVVLTPASRSRIDPGTDFTRGPPNS